MKRLLPPLIVLLILGGVAVRYALRPQRETERARIEARLTSTGLTRRQREDQESEISRYLEVYGTRAEDRWFVARAFMKLGRLDRAVATIWDEPLTAEDPAATARFGSLMLRTMGFTDDQGLDHPRLAAPICTLALAEGGDPQAIERLETVPATQRLGQFIMLYYASFMRGTAATRDILVRSLRSREEREYHIAAAFAAMRPDDYPDREADLAVLLDVVGSPRSRLEQRPMWAASCYGLGRSETREGMALLNQLVADLTDDADPATRADRGIAGAGLVAAGNYTAWDTVINASPDGGLAPLTTTWMIEALIARVRVGDPQALEPLLWLWDHADRIPAMDVRGRMGTKLFLQDEMPDPSIPVDRLLDDLRAADALPSQHAIALAFGMRRGEQGARGAVLEFIRTVTSSPGYDPEAGMRHPGATSPLVTAARALYLYGP
ncbi:MAG: hypothetical protein ACYTG6_02645 [Planctomycetota bacterium]